MADDPTPLGSIPHAEPQLDAPILYFDGVSAAAFYDGMIHLTLEAVVHTTSYPDGKGVTRRKVVAHLRGTPNAAGALQTAMQKLVVAALPAAGEG